MNKDIVISVLITAVITGLLSYTLFSGVGRVDQAVNSQQVAQMGILSVAHGLISEIKDGEYVINTDEGVKIAVRVDSKTTYATSFSPTQAESEALYGTATSTPDGKPFIPKLKLKVGDRIEATSNASTTGNTVVAKIIKLIR